MKKFVLNIIKIIAPFALLLAMVNIFIDPAHIFSNGTYETAASKILLQGHNIDNIENCDERLLVKKMLTNLSYNPEVVVIGTSRSLEISSDFFPAKKFYNCSVSHANINDFIGLLGLLDSTNKLPSEIYIETSPTLINPTLTDEWISLYDFYLYGIKKMQLNLEPIKTNTTLEGYKKKAKTIFALDYFQASISSLKPKKRNHFIDMGNAIPTHFGRMSDGSITYSKAYRIQDTIKAMADADIYVSKAFLPNIDEKYLHILKQIIDYLKSKNVKVILVNIPFQQDCYKIVDGKNKLFEEIKLGINIFAKEAKVPLIGTFNPFEANLNRGQFYDPLHCNKDALHTIFKIRSN